MNREGIKGLRKELEHEITRSQAHVRRIQGELRALQEECEHPAAYRTSHCGESCRDCPDCGGCGV